LDRAWRENNERAVRGVEGYREMGLEEYRLTLERNLKLIEEGSYELQSERDTSKDSPVAAADSAEKSGWNRATKALTKTPLS
jgi:hypothetical protein